MADSQLSVQVVVDASQINGVLEPAAAAAKDAFSDLAAAQIRVKSASYELNSTLNTLAKSGLAPTAEQTEEVAAAMFQAEQAAHSFAAAEEMAYGSTQKVASAANNARVAFTGLTQDIGIRGSRALGSFIAQSETLGPMLNAAFGGVALIAGVELLSRLPGIIIEITDSFMGWDAAAKKTYADIVSGNTQLLLETARTKIQVQELNESSAKGSEKYRLAVEDNIRALKIWGSTSAELLKMQHDIEAELDTLKAKGVGWAQAFGGQAIANMVTGASGKIKQLEADLSEVNSALKSVTQTEQELGQVAGPKAAAEETLHLREETKKAAEEAMNAGIAFAKAMERIKLSQQSLADSQAKLADEEAEFGAQAAGKQAEAELSSLAMRSAAEQKFREDRIRDAEQEAVAAVGVKQKQVEEGLRLGQITNSQALAQLKALAGEKLAIEEKYLNDRSAEIKARLATDDAADYAKDLAAWSKLLSDKLKAETNYQTEIQNVTDKANLAIQKSTATMINSIGNDFTHGFVSWMNGQETFGRAMQKVWTQFADTVVSSLLKAGFQMVANIALQKTLTDSTKLSDAAAAARHTWAAVSAIPIVGPFLAPEAAAAAFAGVMAFESGGMVPGYGPVPAIVHGGEMILNQDQQRALGGGGGNHSFTFNHYGGGSSEQIRTSSREFFKMAKREMRRLNR